MSIINQIDIFKGPEIKKDPSEFMNELNKAKHDFYYIYKFPPRYIILNKEFKRCLRHPNSPDFIKNEWTIYQDHWIFCEMEIITSPRIPFGSFELY